MTGTDPLTVAYVSAVAALAGATLGFAGPQLIASWQKRKRHFAYWSAMSAEADLCQSFAKQYLIARVESPLYRLPTIAYEKGFPALLGDGAITAFEAAGVLLFYTQVEQINRGLDRADATLYGDARADIRHRAEVSRLEQVASTLAASGDQCDGTDYRKHRSGLRNFAADAGEGGCWWVCSPYNRSGSHLPTETDHGSRSKTENPDQRSPTMVGIATDPRYSHHAGESVHHDPFKVTPRSSESLGEHRLDERVHVFLRPLADRSATRSRRDGRAPA